MLKSKIEIIRTRDPKRIEDLIDKYLADGYMLASSEIKTLSHEWAGRIEFIGLFIINTNVYPKTKGD